MGLILENTKYGKLTTKHVHHKEGRCTFWICECECGNDAIVRANNLLTGHTKSCGCLREDFQLQDLTDKRFGNLLVIGVDNDKNDANKIIYMNGLLKRYPPTQWICRCDCGNTISVVGRNLKTGHTKSCGCLRSRAGGHRGYGSRKFKDLTGKKFGKLYVLGEDDEKNEVNRKRYIYGELKNPPEIYWSCQCKR